MLIAGRVSNSDRKFLGRLQAPFFDSSDFSNTGADIVEAALNSAFNGIQWHGSAVRLVSYVTNDRTAPTNTGSASNRPFRRVFVRRFCSRTRLCIAVSSASFANDSNSDKVNILRVVGIDDDKEEE